MKKFVIQDEDGNLKIQTASDDEQGAWNEYDCDPCDISRIDEFKEMGCKAVQVHIWTKNDIWKMRNELTPPDYTTAEYADGFEFGLESMFDKMTNGD